MDLEFVSWAVHLLRTDVSPSCNCGKHCPNIYAEGIWSRSTGRRQAHSWLEAYHTSDSAVPSLLYGPMSCRTQQVLHRLEWKVAVRDVGTTLLDFPVTTARVKWCSTRPKLASATLLHWQKANEDRVRAHYTKFYNLGVHWFQWRMEKNTSETELWVKTRATGSLDEPPKQGLAESGMNIRAGDWQCATARWMCLLFNASQLFRKCVCNPKSLFVDLYIGKVLKNKGH